MQNHPAQITQNQLYAFALRRLVTEGQIIGRSPEGKTAVLLLKMNERDRIQERQRYSTEEKTCSGNDK